MAVAGQAHLGDGIAVMTRKRVLQAAACGAQAGAEFFVRAGVGVVEEHGMRAIERVLNFGAAEGSFGQHVVQREQRFQIEAESHHLVVADAYVDGRDGVDEVLRVVLERLRAGHVVIGVAFQRDVERFARPGRGGDAVAVMVAVRTLDELGRVVGMDAAVQPERRLVKAHARVQEKRLPGERFGHGVARFEPGVYAVAAPLGGIADGREARVVRNMMNRLGRLI